MKKSFVLAMCALMLVCAFAAAGSAATTKGTLKLAHTESAIDLLSSPYMAFTNTFKNIVESQTNGRFKVQVFPNKQLGDQKDLYEQCQRGVIQMTVSQNVSIISTACPEAGLLELPYAFPNTYVARVLLDGPWGEALNNRIAAKTGARVLCWLPTALRCFANNAKEIKSPADMKGLKIRVMPAPMHVEMVKALGAQPTPIAWAELYTALQTGVVAGHEQAPYQIPMAKLDEVSKYMTVDNHVLNVTTMNINEKFFKSLTPEDQKIFRYAARQAQIAILGIVQAKEPADFEAMKKKGMKIYVPTEKEMAQFKALAQPATKKLFVDTLGQKTVDDFLAAIKKAEKDAYPQGK